MKPKSLLTKKNFWIIVANSTAAYVLAYLFVFYTNHFAAVLAAGMFDYSLSIDYNNIQVLIKDFEWTQDAVKVILGSGPVLIFLFGSISLVAYFSLFEEQARVKIFFLWLTLIAFNYFFGGLMIGNLFKKGMGHIFNWLYFTDTQKLIVAMVGFFGLLSTGILMARPVAHSANSYFNKLGEQNFPFFILSQMIMPLIIGHSIIIIFFMPKVLDIGELNQILFQERFGWISLSVILLLIFGRINHFESIYFDEEDRSIRLSYILIGLAVGILLFMRIVLAQSFIIQW